MCDRKNCYEPALYRIPKIGKLCVSCRTEFMNGLQKENPSDEYLTDALDVFMGTARGIANLEVHSFFSKFIFKK